jgi:hypothetical protein
VRKIKAYQLFGCKVQKICQPRLQMRCTIFGKVTQQGQGTLANIWSFISTTQQKKVKKVTP